MKMNKIIKNSITPIVFLMVFVGHAQDHSQLYDKLQYKEKSEFLVSNYFKSMSPRYPFITEAQWNQIKSKIEHNKYKPQTVELLKKHYTLAEIRAIFSQNANTTGPFKFDIKAAASDPLYDIGKLNGRELGLQMTFQLNAYLNSITYEIPQSVSVSMGDIGGRFNRSEDPNFQGSICTETVGGVIKEYYNAELDLQGTRQHVEGNTYRILPLAKPISEKAFHLSDVCTKFDPAKVGKVSRGKYIITDQNECYGITEFTKTRGTGASKNIITKKWAYKRIHDVNSKTFFNKRGSIIKCYGKDKNCEQRYGFQASYNYQSCNCEYKEIDFTALYNGSLQNVKNTCISSMPNVHGSEFEFFGYFQELANVIEHNTNSNISSSDRQERKETAELLRVDLPNYFYEGKITKQEMVNLSQLSCGSGYYVTKQQVLHVINN